jgi:hypothetical protein
MIKYIMFDNVRKMRGIHEEKNYNFMLNIYFCD